MSSRAFYLRLVMREVRVRVNDEVRRENSSQTLQDVQRRDFRAWHARAISRHAIILLVTFQANGSATFFVRFFRNLVGDVRRVYEQYRAPFTATFFRHFPLHVSIRQREANVSFHYSRLVFLHGSGARAKGALSAFINATSWGISVRLLRVG